MTPGNRRPRRIAKVVVLIIASLVLGILASEAVAHDPVRSRVIREVGVEAVEFNIVIDDAGKSVLKQWVGWHSYRDGRQHVAWWFLDKIHVTWSGRPGSYVGVMTKGDIVHVIKANQKYTLVTPYDREVVDREMLPRRDRVGGIK